MRVALRERRWVAGVALAALVLAALLLRLPQLERQPVDVDEVYSLLAARGVLETGHSVFAPTGYPYPRAVVHNFGVAAVMALLGDSRGSARAVSLTCSLLSLLCVYSIGRRLSGQGVALLAVAIVALSRWEALHALSARMYAPFQLAFLLVILLGLRVVERPERWGRWALLVAAVVPAAGIHRLFMAGLPGLLLALAWAVRGTLRWPRIVAGLAAVALATGFGNVLESAAPPTELLRQEYGTWVLSIGFSLSNIGLTFLQFLHERAPLLPWLALLAPIYALARDERKLGFASGSILLASLTATAATAAQSPRYYLHLFPVFVTVGLAVLERLVQDVQGERDTLAELGGGVVRLLDTLGKRVAAAVGESSSRLVKFFFTPSFWAVGGGLLAIVAALLLDPLLGSPFELGHDQRFLIAGGALLLVTPRLQRNWGRLGSLMNTGARLLLLAALVFSLRQWGQVLGAHRSPPFQDEAFAILETQMRPGDRLLATEHFVAFERRPDVPLGFLSQRYRKGRFGPYSQENDWATGAPFVDGAEKLERWLAGPGRTFILTDYRLDLHLEPALRERVEALPLLYRSDPARLGGLSPNPEWSEQTHEYAIRLAEPAL